MNGKLMAAELGNNCAAHVPQQEGRFNVYRGENRLNARHCGMILLNDIGQPAGNLLQPLWQAVAACCCDNSAFQRAELAVLPADQAISRNPQAGINAENYAVALNQFVASSSISKFAYTSCTSS